MNWLKQLLSRRRLRGELSEEIQAHLDQKVEELVGDGMSKEEAMRAARREFGNLGLIEEDSREVWRWPSVEDFLLDIRYGLRGLRHNPVFTTVALLTIAIGIAANAAVFSVVNSVVLKPLGYPKSEELVALHQIAPGAEGLADFERGLLLSPSMYFTYSDHNRTFQSLGVWVAGTANVTGLAEPEQVRTVYVSDGVLQTFGAPPAVGRWFSQDDQVPNGPERAMLSYGYWQRRFGPDRLAGVRHPHGQVLERELADRREVALVGAVAPARDRRQLARLLVGQPQGADLPAEVGAERLEQQRRGLLDARRLREHPRDVVARAEQLLAARLLRDVLELDEELGRPAVAVGQRGGVDEHPARLALATSHAARAIPRRAPMARRAQPRRR